MSVGVGCIGTLKGVSVLVEGMNVDEVICKLLEMCKE